MERATARANLPPGVAPRHRTRLRPPDHQTAPSDTPADEPVPDTWPYPLKLRTLGRFTVVRDDKPLSRVAGHQKPLELLQALIALGGRAVDEAQLRRMLLAGGRRRRRYPEPQDQRPPPAQAAAGEHARLDRGQALARCPPGVGGPVGARTRTQPPRSGVPGRGPGAGGPGSADIEPLSRRVPVGKHRILGARRPRADTQ